MKLTQEWRLILALFIAWLMLVSPTVPLARAAHQLPPGTTGDDFVQVGPMMDKLLIKVFSDETSEFLQLAAGELDFTDWAQTAAFLDPNKSCLENGFRQCPNIGITNPVEEFGIFVFEFNLANTFWGIDMQNGRNPSGVEMRKAVAHLLDKDRFLETDPVVAGFARKTDVFASPSEGPNLGPDPLGFVCSFDTLTGPRVSHTTCLSAYNIASDASGFAELDTDPVAAGNQPSADWKAALDHFGQVRNPATGALGYWSDTDGDGVIDTNRPTSTIDVFCRIDHKPRDRYCNGIASRLNQIFGKTVVTIFEKTISQVSSIVFSATRVNDWHMYSGGYGLTGSVASDLHSYVSSVFASDVCGGPKASFPQQYIFFCDDGNDAGETGDLREVSPGFFVNLNEADMDTAAFKMKFAATLGESKTFENEALFRYGRDVASMSVYSSAAPFAYLKDAVVGGVKATSSSTPDLNPWTGVINVQGFSIFDTRNWRNIYTTEPALPGTARIGFRQGTLHLDWFKLQTVWEFAVAAGLYGTLLETGPYDINQLIGNHANSWVENISPAELGYTPDTVLGVSAGTVKSSIRFNLRTDVFFHDGNQLSGEDIEFSFEQYKAQAAALLQSAVIDMVGVTCGNKNSCIDRPSGDDDAVDQSLDFTVDVHFNKVSFLFIGVGGLPILPKHVWDSDHNGEVDGTKLGLSFDAMKSHALVGSGDWVCRDLVTGQVGGGCSSTGTSDTGPGDSFVLERYRAGADPRKQSLKSVANFREWNYADGKEQAKTGSPLADDQQVDIADLAAVLLCEGQSAGICAYWVVDGGVVDSTERAIVARWLGASRFDQTTTATRWTFPLSWNDYLNTQSFPPILPSIPP